MAQLTERGGEGSRRGGRLGASTGTPPAKVTFRGLPLRVIRDRSVSGVRGRFRFGCNMSIDRSATNGEVKSK